MRHHLCTTTEKEQAVNLSKTNLSKTAILDAASNIGSGVSRRQFIKYSSGLLAAMSAPAVLAHGHGSYKGAMMKGMHKSAVGLQLYTLRDIMKVSVPATLKLVADVGYSVDWLVSLLLVWSNASDGRFLASALGPTKGFHPKSEFIWA